MRTLSLTLALAAGFMLPAVAEELPGLGNEMGTALEEKQGHGWLEVGSDAEWKAALEKAKKQNKLVLVDFTGSDWCGWCIRLKKEVFDKEHFATEAPKNFILVEIDLPRKKPVAEEVLAYRKGLAKQYGVRGYPTILVLDAEGKRVGKTGYRKGGPESYVEHLLELKDKHDKFVALEAKAAAGDEKAIAELKTIKKQRKLTKLLGSINKNNVKDVAGKIYDLHKEGVVLDGGDKNAQYQFILIEAATVRKDVNLFDDARTKIEKLAEGNLKLANYLKRIDWDAKRAEIAPADDAEEPLGDLEG